MVDRRSTWLSVLRVSPHRPDVGVDGASPALANGPRAAGSLLVIVMSGPSLAELAVCRDELGAKAGR
jgi:hypothetical protein